MLNAKTSWIPWSLTFLIAVSAHAATSLGPLGEAVRNVSEAPIILAKHGNSAADCDSGKTGAAPAPEAASTDGSAGKGPGLARFLPTLDKLNAQLKKIKDDDSSVSSVMEFRDQLFTLESLFSVYNDKDQFGKQFKTDHDDIKAFEDHISHLGDQQDWAREATWSPLVSHGVAVQRRLDLAKATAEFRQFLTSGGWIGTNPSRLDQIRKDLTSANWPSPAADKALVANAVAKQVRGSMTEEYDLNDVENGIHKLRRQIRWFQYYSAAMPGVFAKSSAEGCPLNGPIAPRPQTPVGVCKVSSCLTDKIDAAVAQLGDIKGKGANEEAMGQTVGTSITTNATTVYNDLKSSNVMGLLADEVAACGTAP